MSKKLQMGFVGVLVAAVFLFITISAQFAAQANTNQASMPKPVAPKALEASAPTLPTIAPRGYRIVAVGDIMMGSDWPSPYFDDRVTPDGDAAAVVGEKIAALFKNSDITFGNYEGTIHTYSQGAKSCSNPALCYVFRSPIFHAAYLAKAGFNLMSNANNHARDFGEPGRAQTFANLTKAGIDVSAADQDGMRFAVRTLPDGTKVSLVAFGHNPGLMSVNDLARARTLIQQAKKMGHFTIVSCHIGAEGSSRTHITRQEELFVGENRGNPYAFAHAAIDAGGDMVLCHGPHVPRAMEVYKGRLIAYSLGNFWTFGRFNLAGVSGMAPIIDACVDPNGALLSARIISMVQEKPGGPRPDPNNGAAKLIAQLTESDVPEANLSFTQNGEISWPGKPNDEMSKALKCN